MVEKKTGRPASRDADGLTAKQAEFARLYGTGECSSLVDAYRRVYRCGGGDKSARNLASRLAAEPRVMLAIRRHQEARAVQEQRDAEFTRNWITAQLYAIANDSQVSHRDRLAALAMLSNRSDVVYAAPQRTESVRTVKKAEVEAKIDKLLSDFGKPRLVSSK